MLGLAGWLLLLFSLCTAFFFVLVNPYIAPSSIYSNNQPTNPPPYVLSTLCSTLDSTWSATSRCRRAAALPGNGREATPCGRSHWPRSSGNAAETPAPPAEGGLGPSRRARWPPQPNAASPLARPL